MYTVSWYIVGLPLPSRSNSKANILPAKFSFCSKNVTGRGVETLVLVVSVVLRVFLVLVLLIVSVFSPPPLC
jgi:hypothetical protein